MTAELKVFLDRYQEFLKDINTGCFELSVKLVLKVFALWEWD